MHRFERINQFYTRTCWPLFMPRPLAHNGVNIWVTQRVSRSIGRLPTPCSGLVTARVNAAPPRCGVRRPAGRRADGISTSETSADGSITDNGVSFLRLPSRLPASARSPTAQARPAIRHSFTNALLIKYSRVFNRWPGSEQHGRFVLRPSPALA